MALCKKKIFIHGDKVLCLLSLLMLLLVAAQLHADDYVPDFQETEPDDLQERATEPHRYASVYSGYRFITPDGPTAAASPYGRLSSGVIGGLSAGTLGSDLKLTVEGSFLDDDDYQAALFFDYAGLVHFHAESRKFWHNLLYEQLPNTINNPPLLEIKPNDQGTIYGVRTAINQADTRIRLGNNPFHLNLGYWELKREGLEQLRFSDYYGSGPNSVISNSNRVDRYTREGSIGVDGHLRLFNLFYGFNIRDFYNDAADPRHKFYNDADGALSVTPGIQAHNVIPDSRVTSHTIKLFSDLSGGLVTAATYNLTQRENSGGHGEATPAERPSDVIHSVAGDLTYTPSKIHSFALKYRHREIDRSTPAALYYPYSQIPDSPPGVYTATPGVLLVRPATSSVRDTLSFSATFRPAPKVIYRLEYNAELESRDNLPDAQAPGSPIASRSDHRQTHTGTATFYWKPVNGLNLNASYGYSSCDNPSYDASFSDRHTGKLLLTYTANGKWGLTGSYLAQYESGEATSRTDPNANLVIPETAVAVTMPRTSSNNSVNAGLWFNPLERLTISASYSFLQSDIDQTVLLTESSLQSLVATNYRSTAHVYGVNVMYAATEQLDFSLAFQQVLSDARYDVPGNAAFSILTATYSTAGITELTRLDTTETALSARADWRFNAVLGCSLDYSFRQYDSNQQLYNGSVHSTMATLKARW